MAKKGISLKHARGPDGVRLYAIGDVHGEAALLARMHAAIEDDLSRHPGRDFRIIHLGDYVDRGPDSKGVLDRLAEATRRESRIVSLCGNHDVGFLDFMAEPRADGLFAHNGGDRTARSYGVELDFLDPVALRAGHAALVHAIPDAHLDFLSGLADRASFGDFFFCHAGVKPGVPLDEQDPADLIWIRWAFLSHTGLYEKVIVHGHTPVTRPEVLSNRVNVDTGAFLSGRLTALVIDGAEKWVLTVDFEGQRVMAVTP